MSDEFTETERQGMDGATQIMMAMIGIQGAAFGELINALEERKFLPRGYMVERLGLLAAQLNKTARIEDQIELASALFAQGFYRALSENMAARRAAKLGTGKN